MARDEFKSGWIAILGRPNVGKSTLLNALLGEKLSIVSDKPQTTRNRIVGILHSPGSQAIFLDTPGIHKGRDHFNKWMVDQALSTLSEVDLALFVVEGNEPPGKGDRWIAETISKTGKPALLISNKIDLVPAELREKKLNAYRSPRGAEEPLAPWPAFEVSAQTGEGIEALRAEILNRIPPGPKYFPDDQLTDVPERFVAAEIVREQVFAIMRQEIPYAVAVTTDEFKEEDPIRIECTLHVERESQKGMVIGKKGQTLKEIGTRARMELERFLAAKVFLKLWVKVEPDWSHDPRKLAAFGYRTEPQ